MSPEIRTLHIHKFGGSSIATADRVLQVVSLITRAANNARVLVVVSALGGVTDQLEEALGHAVNRSEKHRAIIDDLSDRHLKIATELSGAESLHPLIATLNSVWAGLEELLEGVSLLRECSPRTRDAVIGLGERAAAPIVVEALRANGVDASTVDGRDVIRTDNKFGEANVDFETTRMLSKERLAWPSDEAVIVVPGFIGSTDDGSVTTLGRSGSDYSATILASVLGAEQVVIWTDVDGVLSADPRLVPAAFTLNELSYQEASEMAWFGAKVLHPRTMRPLRAASIPLVIRNTTNSEGPRTLISSSSADTNDHVKAVTSVPDLSLLMIEGTGMMGIPGIAARAFRALAAEDVNILLISQASSEQSICMGIRSTDAESATTVLRNMFDRELVSGDVSKIYTIQDCTVVSLVGDQMRLRPGLAGRMFSTLGRANINVLAIAQGAAETNISAVVADRDAERAVRALHEAFARSVERLHLFIVGPGSVGTRLLDLLRANAPALSDRDHINLRLVGLANSSRMLFDPEGVAFSDAANRLNSEGYAASLEDLLEKLCKSHLERLVFVDTTSSEAVVRLYPALLANGIGIITPNKRGNTRDQDFYALLRRTAGDGNVPFLYETTVGAALPVIQTIHQLVRSGDRVTRIQGILSGTLAFVFNEMKGGKSYSESVKEAHRRGFMEPDPREDLSGEDVARKLLTLARESGRILERDDIQVESLVSPESAGMSAEDFMDSLSGSDDEWLARTQAGAIQYVATMDDNGYRVQVEPVEPGSAMSILESTDNMVVIESTRYSERPLVIQGAGAGPELTASGILSDILVAAERMR